MTADVISFRLQRRLNQQYQDVRRAVSSPAVLGAGMTMPLDNDGLLVLQAPFRPAPFPCENELHAPAALTSSRGRRVALVRLELQAWSEEATSMALAPLAGRPDRWSARRVQQYFALAHKSADTMAQLLAEAATQQAVAAEIATREADSSERRIS